jgi:hypothetical protein
MLAVRLCYALGMVARTVLLLFAAQLLGCATSIPALVPYWLDEAVLTSDEQGPDRLVEHIKRTPLPAGTAR